MTGLGCIGLSVYYVEDGGCFGVRSADVDKMWVERCYSALNRL